MTLTDDRLEAVRARLKASPELEQAVRDAVAAGSVPGLGPDVVRPDAGDVLAAGSEAAASGVRPAAARPPGGGVPLRAWGPSAGRGARRPLMVRDNAVVLEPLPDF